MIYKVYIILVFALIYSGEANSQAFERSRHESKTFKVFKETTLEVNNKYGNIHLFTWDKDSVRFEVNVHVRANKEQKADKIFEYINLDFQHTKFYIVAQTQLKQNKSSFWAEVSDLTNVIFSGKNRAQIDYDVYLPTDMEIKIINKFGNIYFTDYTGNTTILLSNGDLKANEIKGECSISLNFGNASINRVDKGKLDLGYSEVDIKEAGNLLIESKSSTINFRKIKSLSVTSRRDKFFIDEIRTINGNASFSYVTVKTFLYDIDLTTDYGEVKLENIKPDFKLIELKSKYTDIMLNFQAGTSCKINIEHTEATGIYYPDYYKNISLDVIDEKEDNYKTSGYIGEQNKSAGKINILSKSGKVTLKEQIQVF